MTTVAFDLLEQVVARLRAAPAFGVDPDSIRRNHRTTIPRDSAPAIHVVDGDEALKSRGTCANRAQAFMVVLFLRDDAGFAAADPLKLEVMRRLNPATQQWAAGVLIEPGDIRSITEIADADALRVEMDFTLSYTTGLWTLDGLA
jgi:hypothetical protein